MPVFWLFFWSGFSIFMLLFPLADKFLRGVTDANVSSHYWADRPTGRKIKDATQRDVWKKRHPEKSWRKHIRRQKFLFVTSINLSIGFFLTSFPDGSPLLETYLMEEDRLGL